MRLTRKCIAGALFACGAFAVLGAWFILLFVAQPDGVPPLSSAWQTAKYAITESPSPLHFGLMASLPLILGTLAIAAVRAPAVAWALPSRLGLFAVASIAMLIVVMWEASLFAAAATFLLVSNRDG